MEGEHVHVPVPGPRIRVSGDLTLARSVDAASTRHIEAVVRSLQARLGAGTDPVLIRTEVEAEFARYHSARVREFVPILVEHQVQARLGGGL